MRTALHLSSFYDVRYASAMNSAEELRISIPGFVIAAKAWGQKKDRPLVCLHGKLDNAASFDFLAPILNGYRVVSIDAPGLGHSSHYPPGVMPSWKSDGFLLFHVMQALGFDDVDVMAHSLGSLAATLLAMSKHKIVKRLILLDVLGPKMSFSENYAHNFQYDVDTYISTNSLKPTVYANVDDAARERMKIGPLSYHAAFALAKRGTKLTEHGVIWTFDRRLRCLSTTLPHEDELLAMLRAVRIPVGLIKAKQGLSYPPDILENRKRAISNLTVMECQGSHHVHMEHPEDVAALIREFL